MGRIPAWLGWILLGLLSTSVDAGADPVVILLSMDGVRHDYPDRGELPSLERMARDGVRAAALVPVFPSSTFANHVSLATGTHADRHGIVANRFFDPELGEFDYGNDASFIEAEPLWVAAERQGIKAACFFWVGSETDWQGVGASYRRAPFDSSIGEAEKVRQILEWFDKPAAQRPGLIVSWWHGADKSGHRFGPESDRTTDQLRQQDSVLGTLLRALDQRDAWAETTLIVVSDHGMAIVTESLDAGALLRKAGIGTRVVSAGASALVYLDDPAQTDAAVDALRGIDGVRAFPSGQVPEGLRYRHPTRTGHVVVLTDPPRMLSRSSSGLNRWRRISSVFGNTIGTHGYDPKAHPEMGAIFFAVGRGVPPGASLGSVRSIDVAPTVTRLLGIDPPRHAEGAPISSIAPPP